MKPKFILLTIGLLGFILARANSKNPGENNGKKEDILGLVVHSDTKKPLKDVSVTAYSVSKKEKVTITNEEGNYSFDELKPGTYKFVFEKSGFKKVTKEKVVVKTDEAFQLNIEMIETGDFDMLPSPFHFTDLN